MQKISLIVMSFLYILAGINHFVSPGFYLKLMPHYIPFHLFLIYFTGMIEIILGALLFSKKYRKKAGWLIILMLIAFLPVHIQMIINTYAHPGLSFVVALIRLPFQFVLMYWAYKVCNLKLSIS